MFKFLVFGFVSILAARLAVKLAVVLFDRHELRTQPELEKLHSNKLLLNTVQNNYLLSVLMITILLYINYYFKQSNNVVVEKITDLVTPFLSVFIGFVVLQINQKKGECALSKDQQETILLTTVLITVVESLFLNLWLALSCFFYLISWKFALDFAQTHTSFSIKSIFTVDDTDYLQKLSKTVLLYSFIFSLLIHLLYLKLSENIHEKSMAFLVVGALLINSLVLRIIVYIRTGNINIREQIIDRILK